MKELSEKNIIEVLERLKEAYGTRPWNWHTQQKPFYVLISTILSQRTRDPQTDAAAQALLRRFPTPHDLAHAPPDEIALIIRGVNYHRTKALRVKEVSRIIAERYGGKVPTDLESLLSLPGVGPKTANCVLLYGFHQAVLPVDTHVHRIANRLGWVNTRRPEETEENLKEVIPKTWIPYVNDLFVKHGQTLCRPKRPLCEECNVRNYCQYWKDREHQKGPEKNL
ncbi:endonuclease III domain-containing protein [Thermodesulforhabdus norvegica]|uniref:Endonuclease III n=1 Tax=Thermodesulforhabdus norvegica TaxID=39841 RepID=A0A1I4RDM9_9BACT|nr:endonuclease III [Thermodesulforhabdus norvegica]SFM50319.1 DNA-(apurinic or apyrimidinic site) lyase /endonuclease III [Thermodesulforhabdus norvegica]